MWFWVRCLVKVAPCQVGMPNKILAHAERPESLASPNSCSPSHRIRGRVSLRSPHRERSFDAAVPLYGESLTLHKAGFVLVVAVAPDSSSWKYTVCTRANRHYHWEWTSKESELLVYSISQENPNDFGFLSLVCFQDQQTSTLSKSNIKRFFSPPSYRCFWCASHSMSHGESFLWNCSRGIFATATDLSKNRLVHNVRGPYP
jgi:hypothetical protein